MSTAITTELDELCDEYNVDLDELMGKITSALGGCGTSRFSHAELNIIRCAIEIAGEF